MSMIAPVEREAVEATPRKAISRQMRNAVVMDQGGKCPKCGGTLLFNVDYELDHIVPLWLGGKDCAENWQALCPPCHRAKTKTDVRAIAKAKRLIVKQNPETRKPSQFKSRGFDKTKTRKFSSEVVNK